MSNDERLREALAELRRERQRGEKLRADYRSLVESRFYALRTWWNAAKAALGGPSARRSFVDWNAGMLAPPQFGTVETVDPAEALDLWRKRVPAKVDQNVMISVIIPVYNHVAETVRCLHSIARVWSDAFCVEVILADDASHDETHDVLHDLPGITYLRSEQNVGFLRNANAAAERARGRYICFLNNDTVVRDGWLEHLVHTAERDPKIGAVGAKLLYPNGRLQEAGAILWNDASGWNYGRNGDPNDSRYNYERDVDYCSGAALLVRAGAFRDLGGFSERFAPAYYEDADLCFALRAAGYRVVYQPRAVVTHVEGASSGTELDAGVKQHQALNQPKFYSKWANDLKPHLPPDPANVEAGARRLVPFPRVLVIDTYVPMHDREAGSNRLLHIVRYLRSRDYGVVFLPDNYAPLQPYTDELERIGVEVLYHSDGGRDLDEALAETLRFVDVAWICRPELFTKYANAIRRSPGVRVVYDTIDLHFVRMHREAALLGSSHEEAKRHERLELEAARSAHATVVVSPEEKRVLEDRGIENVFVVPTIHDRCVQTRSYEGSEGLLFIGNYQHAPNVDAARFLVREIMPLVWERIPTLEVTLLGANTSAEVRELAGTRVRVPGYVADVAPYFERARVFAAPLRFGAGIKGKIGQAMAYGVPVAATHVAAEGFGFEDGVQCLIADDVQSFADAIVRIYTDRELWGRLSAAVLEHVDAFSSANVGRSVAGVLRQI